MTTMSELYQGVIIENDRSPRNYRKLDAPTHHAAGRNPLCGDEVSIELRLDSEGRIAEIGFQGKGCAISRASASLMTTAIQGKTVAETRELFDRFHALVTSGQGSKEELGKLVVFSGLSGFPMRVKCATMSWHALIAALDQGEMNNR